MAKIPRSQPNPVRRTPVGGTSVAKTTGAGWSEGLPCRWATSVSSQKGNPAAMEKSLCIADGGYTSPIGPRLSESRRAGQLLNPLSERMHQRGSGNRPMVPGCLSAASRTRAAISCCCLLPIASRLPPTASRLLPPRASLHVPGSCLPVPPLLTSCVVS